MGGQRPKLAYLAPEIPALSATFVYREILGLMGLGFEVLPISVHHPHHPASEPAAKDLMAKTCYLYAEGFQKTLIASFKNLILHPVYFFRALGTLSADVLRVGLVSRSSFKLIYQFFRAQWVASKLRTEKVDHLHIHFAHVPTQIGMYAAMIAHIPFSFTSHANDLFERGLLLKTKVERAACSVTISEYNKRFLVDQAHAPEDKIAIVRCGVDSTAFESLPQQSAQMDLAIKRPVIGTLGRMVEKKGMDVLIKAMGLLRQRGMDFELQLAGDGPLRESLAELVDDYEFADKTRFKGALRHDQVPAWMKKLDLFVLACQKDQNGDQDGIPVVLMEAMGLGIPVISTQISGIPELIADGKTGYLATPGEASELADKIAQVFEHPETTQNLVKAAHARVLEEFDTGVNLDRLIHIFEGGYHARGEKTYRRHLAHAR